MSGSVAGNCKICRKVFVLTSELMMMMMNEIMVVMMKMIMDFIFPNNKSYSLGVACCLLLQ